MPAVEVGRLEGEGGDVHLGTAAAACLVLCRLYEPGAPAFPAVLLVYPQRGDAAAVAPGPAGQPGDQLTGVVGHADRESLPVTGTGRPDVERDQFLVQAV